MRRTNKFLRSPLIGWSHANNINITGSSRRERCIMLSQYWIDKSDMIKSAPAWDAVACDVRNGFPIWGGTQGGSNGFKKLDIFWQKESELGRFEKVAKIIFCNMQFYPTRTLCYEFLPSNEARKCNFITTQGWEEGISATQILKFEFPAKIFNFQTSPVRQCFRDHWISLARLNIAVWKLYHTEFNMCRSTLLTGIWS